MDVLTHAMESYVSVMASDYTRGLSLQAIKLTFEYLKSSVEKGDKVSERKCITHQLWLVWHLQMHS